MYPVRYAYIPMTTMCFNLPQSLAWARKRCMEWSTGQNAVDPDMSRMISA